VVKIVNFAQGEFVMIGMYISFFLASIFGVDPLLSLLILAIVLTHNVWVANWRVLITLIGWLMLIRGAVRILAPETIMDYAKNLLRNKQIMPIAGGVTGVLGLVFCYFGYAA